MGGFKKRKIKIIGGGQKQGRWGLGEGVCVNKTTNKKKNRTNTTRLPS